MAQLNKFLCRELAVRNIEIERKVHDKYKEVDSYPPRSESRNDNFVGGIENLLFVAVEFPEKILVVFFHYRPHFFNFLPNKGVKVLLERTKNLHLMFDCLRRNNDLISVADNFPRLSYFGSQSINALGCFFD